MSPLTQSPFLQALGYSIINSLWQFALLWLIYVSVNTVLKLSSHQKYTTGYLLQAGGFIWFVVTFTIYFHQFSQSTEVLFPLYHPYLYPSVPGNIPSVREEIFWWFVQIENFLPYLSVVYLVLLGFAGARCIRAYHFTRLVKTRQLHTIEISWRFFVKQLSDRLGIKREVKIYVSEMVKTPLTIGFFKPFILIPLASLNHLSIDQMEAVIVHELAHIKRLDYLFNLFLAIIETALLFNPFTILISRHIKRERENCCDDWVLQYNYNAASYAGALLQIATCQSGSYLLTLNAADNKQVLLNRIKRMIEKKEKSFFNYRYQLTALFVMITVLSSLALLSSRHTLSEASVSAIPAAMILQQITTKPDDLLMTKVLHSGDLSAKKFLAREQQFQKNLQKKLSFSALPAETTVKNKKAEISEEQINSEPIPLEANEVSYANNDLFAQAGLEKNMVESNKRLNELLSAGVQLKERQIALAKQEFKKVAADVFKEKKTFFEQKQFHEQMKAAFEQIKAAQIQLDSVQHMILLSRENNENTVENEIAQVLQLFPVNIHKSQYVTKKLQLEIKKSRKRSLHSTKQDSIFFNYHVQLLAAVFNFPSQSKTRSFSFEFSEKSKAKSVVVTRLRGYKEAQKIKKAFIEDAEEKDNFKIPDISPLVPEQLLPEMTRPKKRFYIISI